MRQCILAIAALLALALFAQGAEDKAPTIVFDSLNQDFGRVMEGELLKHVFTFTNKGTATLEILKVESS